VRAAPPVRDRFAFGNVFAVPPGSWVRYSEGGKPLGLRLLERTDELATVEIERGEEILLQKIAPGGVVVRSWAWIDGKAVEQRVLRSPEPSAPVEWDPPDIRTGSRTLGRRSIATTRVERSRADAEGTLIREVYEFSRDLPSLFTSTGDAALDAAGHGAVVSISAPGRPDIELQDWGADARPSVDWPQ
jgi:hypothetical protein